MAKIVNLSRDELKAALTEAGIEFQARLGDKKLAALCEANGIATTREQLRSSSIVPDAYKKAYGPDQHCGDELAVMLKEEVTDSKGHCALDKLEAVMAENGISTGRWSHLNIGQQRMNLGNVLRNRVKNGEFVVVGEHEFNSGAERQQA